MIAQRVLLSLCLAAWPGSVLAQDTSQELPARIGFHKAVYDAQNRLLPWTSWNEALKREMQWYLACPPGKKGYPVYFYTTFMDGEYCPYKDDFIPATQLGMGIISYVKYWRLIGKTDPRVLQQAARMADFLIRECLTADRGCYPRFPRSTGYLTELPITRSSQGDEKFGAEVIQPDKGGIVGYSLLLLEEAQPDARYVPLASHIADVLVKNMRTGNARRAPWPFRVDARTGKHWGDRNGNMAYILRLLDSLIARGLSQYQAPRDALWSWIKTYQIPAPEGRSENHWIQFFEDMAEEDNRNSWSALEMARYLIERKASLDPNWKPMAETCIQFAMKHFALQQPGGVVLMGEQDSDPRPWGGACSKLGGVAALFYAAGGGAAYREIAYRNLNWVSYFIDSDGGPAAMCRHDFKKGSWQEDCHTDVVHNFVDALQAVPEFAGPPGKRP